jgi:dynein heavy chain
MCFETNIYRTPAAEITAFADDGAFVNGMFLEGARWDLEEGVLADQQLKQVCCCSRKGCRWMRNLTECDVVAPCTACDARDCSAD